MGKQFGRLAITCAEDENSILGSHGACSVLPGSMPCMNIIGFSVEILQKFSFVKFGDPWAYVLVHWGFNDTELNISFDNDHC